MNRAGGPDGQEWFRTTLYSIGDAVITTDAEGRVREMNPVAENLTGWPEAQAVGRPVGDVLDVQKAARRSADLTRQLLAFARREPARSAPGRRQHAHPENARHARPLDWRGRDREVAAGNVAVSEHGSESTCPSPRKPHPK